MIDNLAVIEESHLEDPDGNVERRLRMYSRNDVLQIKELEDILATPSPLPSTIVRNWPERMWCRGATKIMDACGVRFCAIGILAETGGHEWGKPNWDEAIGKKWDASTGEPPALFVGKQLGLDERELHTLGCRNDSCGKEAAASYLESLGL